MHSTSRSAHSASRLSAATHTRLRGGPGLGAWPAPDILRRRAPWRLVDLRLGSSTRAFSFPLLFNNVLQFCAYDHVCYSDARIVVCVNVSATSLACSSVGHGLAVRVRQSCSRC